jgi:hypothetical protein
MSPEGSATDARDARAASRAYRRPWLGACKDTCFGIAVGGTRVSPSSILHKVEFAFDRERRLPFCEVHGFAIRSEEGHPSSHRSAGANSAAARIPDASTSARSGRSHSARSRCTQCKKQCGCRRRTSTLGRMRRMLQRRGWPWEVWRRPHQKPPPWRVASARAAPSADAEKMQGSACAARCEEERKRGSRAMSESVGGRKLLMEDALRRRPCQRVTSGPMIPRAVSAETDAPLSPACHGKGRGAIGAHTSRIGALGVCQWARTRPEPFAQNCKIAAATKIAPPRHGRRA